MLGASDAASTDSGGSPRFGATLDERGRLRVARSDGEGPASQGDAAAVAAACCAVVSRLLHREISVVATRVADFGDRAMAVTTVRDSATYLGGSAVAGEPGEAIGRSVSQAVGLADGALVMGARRWWGTGSVKAVLVVESSQDTFVEGEPEDVERQRALAGTVPEVGRLTVATESGEHRLLRLPDAILVVTCDRDAPVLDEIDEWCADVEALSD